MFKLPNGEVSFTQLSNTVELNSEERAGMIKGDSFLRVHHMDTLNVSWFDEKPTDGDYNPDGIGGWESVTVVEDDSQLREVTVPGFKVRMGITDYLWLLTNKETNAVVGVMFEILDDVKAKVGGTLDLTNVNQLGLVRLVCEELLKAGRITSVDDKLASILVLK